MVFYSIKYIETHGIETLEDLVEHTSASGKVYATNQGNGLRVFLIVGKECFRTEEEAIKAGVRKLNGLIKSTETKKQKLKEKLEQLKNRAKESSKENTHV